MQCLKYYKWTFVYAFIPYIGGNNMHVLSSASNFIAPFLHKNEPKVSSCLVTCFVLQSVQVCIVFSKIIIMSVMRSHRAMKLWPVIIIRLRLRHIVLCLACTHLLTSGFLAWDISFLAKSVKEKLFSVAWNNATHCKK